MASTPRLRLVVVSGVTGAGKTTWARALADHSGGVHLDERVPANPFFARAQARESPDLRLLAQVRFLIDAVEQLATAPPDRVAVADHSPWEVAEVYTEHLHRRGLLTDTGREAVPVLYDACRAVTPLPDVVLLVSATPDTIRARLRRRARPSDRRPSNDELTELSNRRVTLWGRLNVPVVQIDTTDTSPPTAFSPEVVDLWRTLTRSAGREQRPGHQHRPPT